MDFVRFAESYGLIINRLDYGRWVRVPTEDHRTKRNGAYKLLDNIGWIQNHATMQEPVTWRPGADAKPIDQAYIRECAAKSARERAEGQKRAASKAGWILKQCKRDLHPYLDLKGFPEDTGNVWDTGTDRLLVIPMRIGTSLVGCQLIDAEGGKKFLTGQRTNGAEFVIDNKGRPVLTEGYATALSIRAALASIKVRYRLHVCFSAGNLSRIAKAHENAIIVADHDLSGTGQRIAKESGRPFFLPPMAGTDFNDYHRVVGLFAASQALRKIMMT